MDSTFLNPAKVVEAAGIFEGMKVADFDASSGFFTRAAGHAVGPFGVVWAVDLQRDILSRIKNLALAEGLENVEVVHGDVSRLGGSTLPADFFDFVILANTLFTHEDKSGVVAEAQRVLKPGGNVVVVDWAGSFGGLGPHEGNVVSEEAADALFAEAGFQMLGWIEAGSYHWGFVVRKKAPVAAQ